MQGEIGQRVLGRIAQVWSDRTHREIADDVGMTPDALSRALNGKRSFSSIELARVADLLDADIHWLITGEPDPHRLVVAARHDFDHQTGQRDVPGRDKDEAILNDVALAYRQAFVDASDHVAPLPDSADAARRALGDDFVRPFADRLEGHLGVDVVRMAEVSTAYSFTIAGRPVIVLAATGNWFRENWSIAHELGHLALGHHDNGLSGGERDQHEVAANAFAAELLLPSDQMNEVDWAHVDADELAQRVWNSGVSTAALSHRLTGLGIRASADVERWAAQPTQRLLRRHGRILSAVGDPITRRMDEAATRRFPLGLQNAHLVKIAAGDLGKGTLAWMLGIDPDALEVDTPAPVEDVDSAQLAEALGL